MPDLNIFFETFDLAIQARIAGKPPEKRSFGVLAW
jgi:hypothetical protein